MECIWRAEAQFLACRNVGHLPAREIHRYKGVEVEVSLDADGMRLLLADRRALGNCHLRLISQGSQSKDRAKSVPQGACLAHCRCNHLAFSSTSGRRSCSSQKEDRRYRGNPRDAARIPWSHRQSLMGRGPLLERLDVPLGTSRPLKK